MKATGNFENARHVDPLVVLSDDTRAHIDHWLTKFPPERKRSAVLQGLHAAQEQNQGWLSDELIGSSDPAGFQMRVKRKDGSLFDARLYVSPLIDAVGKQTGWMASMTDITEPKRAREELAAAHERFTTVLESLDAAVSVLAADEAARRARIVHLSPSAALRLEPGDRLAFDGGAWRVSRLDLDERPRATLVPVVTGQGVGGGLDWTPAPPRERPAV